MLRTLKEVWRRRVTSSCSMVVLVLVGLWDQKAVLCMCVCWYICVCVRCVVCERWSLWPLP